jgi:hypothetical protein
MSNFLYFVIVFFVLVLIGIAAYLLTARKYQSSTTVADSYDQWTVDGILEFYWGEHIHFGHSGFIKSLREMPTFLLMRLAFGAGLCRFGMFRAVRANSRPELMDRNTKIPQAWLGSDRMMTNFEFQAISPSPNPYLANCDVVIVGGSIAGLTLACGLQPSGLQILVVEAQQQQANRRSSRAYALLPLTSKIFLSLGLWEQIATKISHFSRVLVSDADYPHRVEFCPKDLGEAAVYYCAEHGVLMSSSRRSGAKYGYS